MEQYVGLDVSQKETAVCVIDTEGKKIWQGSCRSTPSAISETLRCKAPGAIKIAMATGPLAVWHWHELKAAGFPVVCIHARHARAALAVQLNKTDMNDALGLAQIVRTGWYRPVDVKSMESHKLRLIVAARARLVSMRTALYRQIRGLLKTFGIVLPPGKGGTFERLVLNGVADDHHVRFVIESLLTTWRHLTLELKKFNREIVRAARTVPICRKLMSVPGVGALTALAFVTAVDKPDRFRRSSDLGPYLGLAPRRYQSGEVDRWFQNLFDARRKIAAWRKEYNESRPHRSLGERTPSEFACQIALKGDLPAHKSSETHLEGVTGKGDRSN